MQSPYSKDYIDDSVTKKVIASDKTNREIYSIAIDFFHSEIASSDIAKNYISLKKYEANTINHFKVGIVQNSDKLFQKLREKYNKETIVNSGLFYDSEKCIFSDNYLTFPIIKDDSVMNIKAKDIINQGDDRKDNIIPLKYAGNNYTLTLNQDAVYSSKEEEIIIVEGENDLLATWEKDSQKVIAILGQLKNNQIVWLKTLSEKTSFILAFDNDEAGNKYTDRFVKSFEKTNHPLFRLKYSDKDPFIAIRNNSKRIKVKIDRRNYLEEIKLKKEQEDRIYFETIVKPKEDNVLQELNDNFYKTELSGKIAYVKTNKNTDLPPTFFSFKSLCQKYSAHSSVVYKWDKEQITYDGVVYDFSGKEIVDNKVNLFFGFVVKPSKHGNTDLIHSHILNIICSGDKASYELLLDFIAHLFQKPNEIVRIALTLIGPESAGKGLFIEDILMKIIGKKYTSAIRNSSSYLNNFNSVLEGKLLLFIDEASFSGSTKEASVLKGLIGNPSILVERKGYESYMTNFCGRFFFSSNGTKPIKMPIDNTRYWVMKVDGKYAYAEEESNPDQIKYYMDQVRHQMANGGLEKFLWEMLERDITDFNRFHVPKTEQGIEMIKEALTEFDAWFYGSMFDELNDELNWKSAPSWVSFKRLVGREILPLYEKYIEKRGDKYDKLNPTQFMVKLKEKLGKHGEYKKTRDFEGQSCYALSFKGSGFDVLYNKYKDLYIINDSQTPIDQSQLCFDFSEPPQDVVSTLNSPLNIIKEGINVFNTVFK